MPSELEWPLQPHDLGGLQHGVAAGVSGTEEIADRADVISCLDI